MMGLYKEILKIQKFRRIVSYTGFYCFVTVVSYAYTSNTTRAGYSRADQFYASYPAGTELLTDTAKLYKAALGTCFETEEWGPIEFCIMEKHFERQGKSPYAYHSPFKEIAAHAIPWVLHGISIQLGLYIFNTWHTFSRMDDLTEVAKGKCQNFKII